MGDDWQTVRLSDLAFVDMGQSPPSEYVSDAPSSGLAFLQGNAEFSDRYPVPKFWCSRPTKRARGGDTLISVRAPVGELNRADQDYCIGRGLAAIRFRNADKDFGYHSLSLFARSLRRVAQGTTFEAIGGVELRKLELDLPPPLEQTRIAAILDTLDDTIRQTEQVIAKLQQMKQGLLHDLLTRGIDENGEVRDPERRPELFKDSALGRIPRGWDDRKVGSLIIGIEQGWSPDCRGWPASAGSWGVLKTTAVTWAGYDGGENKELPEALSPRREYEVRPNDVLMTRAGPNSRVGVVALVEKTPPRVMLSDKLYRIVPGSEVRPDFLVLSLSGNRTQMHLSRLKTGLAESQTNISQAIVRALRVSIPPLVEQERIARRIELHDRVAWTENEALLKLRVLKQGLMDDLLTGKVRVPATIEVAA
jgi:type I restriction enzyme S subunit